MVLSVELAVRSLFTVVPHQILVAREGMALHIALACLLEILTVWSLVAGVVVEDRGARCVFLVLTDTGKVSVQPLAPTSKLALKNTTIRSICDAHKGTTT